MPDDAVRFHRLHALLAPLCGEPEAASRLADAMLLLQDDRAAQSLDRMALMRVRELARGRVGPAGREHRIAAPDDDARWRGLDPESRALLLGCGERSREWFILSRVLGLDDRAVARAMDCSVTALDAHRRGVAPDGGEERLDRAAAAVRAWMRDARPAEGVRVRRERRIRLRRRVRRSIWIALLAVALVVILFMLEWWSGRFA